MALADVRVELLKESKEAAERLGEMKLADMGAAEIVNDAR